MPGNNNQQNTPPHTWVNDQGQVTNHPGYQGQGYQGTTYITSPIDRRNNAGSTYDQLSDYLFDQVTLITVGGNSVLTSGANVTSTTTWDNDFRIQDTSQGRFMDASKPSRTRLIFYSGGAGASKLDCYIMSPAFSTSTSTFSPTASYVYFAGLKVYAGALSLAVKDKNGLREQAIPILFEGTTTYVIDMQYTVNSIIVYIDGVNAGSMQCSFGEAISDTEAFYPVIVPTRSTDGTGVSTVSDISQFIQQRGN